jgi:hypothetical protein
VTPARRSSQEASVEPHSVGRARRDHGPTASSTPSLAPIRAFALRVERQHDFADELVQARQRAVLLTGEYNASCGQPAADLEAILRRLLRQARSGGYFEPDLHFEFGNNVTLGDGFSANFDCVLLGPRHLPRGGPRGRSSQTLPSAQG